jgi:hypothetical protein
MGYLFGGLALLYLYAKSQGQTISQTVASFGVPSSAVGAIVNGATYVSGVGGTTNNVPGAPLATPTLSGSQNGTGNGCGCSLESPGYKPAGNIPAISPLDLSTYTG